MIAVFLYTSCYDVTVLHVTLLLKHFNKHSSSSFLKSSSCFIEDLFAFWWRLLFKWFRVKIIRVTL